MLKRFSIRLLKSTASLSIAVLLAFAWIRFAPGDPVEQLIASSDEYAPSATQHIDSTRAAWRHRLGLELPLFYWSIVPLDESTAGHWIPLVRWHADNQFHRWLLGDGIFSKGIVRGDFGISYSTRQPVAALLEGRIGWSIGLSFVAMALAFCISIPVALRAARLQGSTFDRLVRSLSLSLLSLPLFWVALVLLTLFANPAVLNWFPASGVGPLQTSFQPSWWQHALSCLPYLVLPIICYTVGSTAFLLHSIRDAAVREMRSDYAVTAAAKGQREQQILYKHVLPNLTPALVTLFAFAFPAALSGSVIIEYSFGIPGMGSLLQDAALNKDYPVLSAVFLISAVMTLTGFGLADILSSRSDPRIKEGGHP